MKTLKFLTVVVGVVLGASSTAVAHEGEMHAAGGGLFGLPPEYVHILINPMPVYGMAMGILALAGAFLMRNKNAQLIGLCLIIIAAASAWPVAHYGQNAYKHVRGVSDDTGQDALDEHMERAEKVIYVFYATAFLGLVALVTRRKFPKAATPLAVVIFIMGVASLGAGGWISKAGGQIRHPEFRVMSAASTNVESPEHSKSAQAHDDIQPAEASGHTHEMAMPGQTSSTNAPTHGNDMSGQSHEKMLAGDANGHKQEMAMSDQTTATNTASQPHGASEQTHEMMQSMDAGSHKYEMQMPGQATEQTPMPDTIEGVWKAIHEQDRELESSVNARQFKAVQSPAAMLGDLAGHLTELAQPDQKAAVETGVEKITHALDELKSSAETGSDTVMKMRFQEFEEAMTGLEQQMIKQQPKGNSQ
jgi:hypothetical protein